MLLARAPTRSERRDATCSGQRIDAGPLHLLHGNRQRVGLVEAACRRWGGNVPTNATVQAIAQDFAKLLPAPTPDGDAECAAFFDLSERYNRQPCNDEGILNVRELIAANPIIVILGVVFLALGALHYFTRPKNRKAGRHDPLVTACMGDRAKADRLVRYELTRDPRIGQSEARKRAFDRLADDRRRG